MFKIYSKISAILLLLTLIGFSLFKLSTIKAQESPTEIPTPNTKISVTPSNDVEEIRKAVSEKVKEKLGEITSSTPRKASWTGTISRIDPTQIVIDTPKGPRNINVSDDTTTVINSKRIKIDLAKLVQGDSILCLGYTSSDKPDSLDTKRIIVYDPKTIIRQQIVLGKIVDVSQTTSILVLIPNNNKNLQYQIKTDIKTILNDNQNKKLKTDSLVTGKKIVAIIQPDPKIANTFYASRLIFMDAPIPSTTPSPTPTPASQN